MMPKSTIRRTTAQNANSTIVWPLWDHSNRDFVASRIAARAICAAGTACRSSIRCSHDCLAVQRDRGRQTDVLAQRLEIGHSIDLHKGELLGGASTGGTARC